MFEKVMLFLVVSVKNMGHVNHWILSGCKIFAIIALASMTILILMQVVFRDLLNNALPWSEELARYLMVWMTFLTLPIVSHKLMHASLTVLNDYLKGWSQDVLMILVYGICLCVMGAAGYFSIGFAEKGTAILASSLSIHKVWSYAALPIGFTLSACVYLELFLKTCLSVVSRQAADLLGSLMDIQKAHQTAKNL